MPNFFFQIGEQVRGKTSLRLGLLALLLSGLPGCQSFDISGSANVAQIRIVDASVDAPGIDMYQSGSALAYNLAFGTVTSYVAVPSGAYNVAAARAGTTQTLVTTKHSLAPGHQYTAIIGNIAANMHETVLTDQTTPAPAGQTAVRVVNQALRPGAVDLYLVPTNGKLVTTQPLATNVIFQANTGYINVPEGKYAVAVVPAGTALSSKTNTLLTGSFISYAGGSVRTIILLDLQSSTANGVQVIVAADYEPSSSAD